MLTLSLYNYRAADLPLPPCLLASLAMHFPPYFPQSRYLPPLTDQISPKPRKPDFQSNNISSHRPFASLLPRDYFFAKKDTQINTGDLLLMYDTLSQVLKRNIRFGKYLMTRNDTLNERIEEMEIRSVQLSKELGKISENWKTSRKLDVQR